MAGESLRELVTTWSFEFDDKPLKELDEALNGLKEAAFKVGVGIAAAAGTIFGFAKLTAEAGDEFYKMSQRIGVGVEELSSLAYAAKLSEVSTESLGTSLRFLNKHIYEASQGSAESQKGFKDLGLSIRDSGGQLKTADVLLKEVANKFEGLKDGPRKTALSLQLFGRAGAGMIPFLNEGGEAIEKLQARAEELGVTFSKEEAFQSQEFNDSLHEMMSAFTGITHTIGKELIPILTPLVQQFTNMVVAHKKVIATNISGFIKGLSKYLEITFRWMGYLVDSAKGVIQALGGIEAIAKVLGVTMALIGGAGVLAAIGSVASAVVGLIGLFTAANAAALAIPIGIGLAVVGLGLVIEDIISFFQGKGSVFGELLKQGDLFFDWLNSKLPGLGDVGRVFVTALLTPLRAVVNALREAYEIGQTIFGDKTLKQLGSDTLDNISNFFGGDSGTLSGSLGILPKSLPGSAASASNGDSSQTVNAPVTVNVGEGANPFEVAKAVKSGVLGGIDAATLKASKRSLSSGGW